MSAKGCDKMKEEKTILFLWIMQRAFGL